MKKDEEKDLPEPIEQHIFSFLDFKDVIRASLVSRIWNAAASTMQFLNVTDDNVCYATDGVFCGEVNPRKRKRPTIPKPPVAKARSKLKAVTSFIEKAGEQNSPIQKFSLVFSENLFWDLKLGLKLKPHINQCITALVLGGKANVKELVIHAEPCHPLRISMLNFHLPDSVYTASSLHKDFWGSQSLFFLFYPGLAHELF